MNTPPLFDTDKRIPFDPSVRRRLREAVEGIRPESFARFSRRTLEPAARDLLEKAGLPGDFLAWTMVLLGSRLWRDRVAAVPYGRRLLLLPHCMRSSTRCPAEYSDVQLLCRHCGACELSRLQRRAESLGYSVLIAEGTPVVMQSILGNEIDAILGVGCLKSLERAFEKLLIAGIPAMAVPLDTGECKDSQVEIEAVFRMIETPYIPPDEHTVDRAHSVTTGPPPSMLHLLRGTARLFESPAIEHLLPRKRVRETGASDASSAIGTVESLGFEFLVRGGKYYRPFIMLAVYDALTGSGGTLPDGANVVDGFPDHVKRTAMAIEIFHKASLIHDDIEDDDPFRYGAPALHTSHGIPAAINTGDYLLGLGYRLIAEQRHRLGASAVEILAELSGAHTRLTEGQGMELYWKSQPATELERLSSSEVLKIYALKTAPAFEAALQIGVHLAATTMSAHATGPDRQDGQDRASVLSGLTASAGRGVPSAVSPDVSLYVSRLVKYSRHLGVGFQIRNDLDDWDVEPGNKRLAGRDLVDRRPTLLLAIALERLESEERGRLVRALGNADRIGEIRELYERADVFATARSLIGRHAVRSHEIAAECGDGPFRELLDHFVEALLE